MIFIETSLFTKLLPNYLSDEEYREFQELFIDNPHTGDLIQGGYERYADPLVIKESVEE